MRPRSIVLFERVVILGILLGVAGSVLNWGRTLAAVRQFGFGAGFVIGVQAASIVLVLLLVYFIARKASTVAKWIFVVLVLLGVLNILRGAGLLLSMGPSALLSVAQMLIQLFAVWLLFRPDSAAWFDGKAA